MNNNINSVRGITIIGIMYIHTISFLVDYNDLSYIVRYLFSMASLCVPLLFMISGYLFNRSKNQKRNTKKLVYTYLKFVIVVILINLFILHVKFDIYKIFLFNQSSIGYLWFIKVLIYFQLIILSFKYCKSGLVFILLLFIVSTVPGTRIELYFYGVNYFTGYYISKSKHNIFSYIPKYFWVFSLTMPFMLQLQYYTYSVRVYLMTIIVFTCLLKIKSNHPIKFLEYFSKNGLTYLTFQYLSVELLLRIQIDYKLFIPTFITVLILSTIFVLVYDFIEQRFREELSKS